MRFLYNNLLIWCSLTMKTSLVVIRSGIRWEQIKPMTSQKTIHFIGFARQIIVVPKFTIQYSKINIAQHSPLRIDTV